MDKVLIEQAFNLKRRYFDEGHTKSYEYRIRNLEKLENIIKNNEEDILIALHKDLSKTKFEGFISELGVVYNEINYIKKNLKSWMKPKKVNTPLSLQSSRSYIYSEPLGVCLIIGPWNYPFQLIMSPLIGAIAAGNCVILKPSNEARYTSDLICKIIGDNFDEEYISVIEGSGRIIGPMLIELYRFDHIFFTGSIPVGKKIAEAASKHLTPITLELGGKSPVIVYNDVNIDVTAKRIVWAKYFNNGQTCVAPDYLLVHRDIKDKLLDRMKHYIKEFYGDDSSLSKDYGRIINEKRFDILSSYLDEGKIIIGGKTNKEDRFISPTVIDNLDLDSVLMKEEIFGPILPVITFDEIEDTIDIIRKNRYPLALYLFTEDKEVEFYIINTIQFGGGCINNGLVHLTNSLLPFGGVGYSGVGNYHGKYSFDTFSHKKSIIKTKSIIEHSLKYPPYSDEKMRIARRLFR